MLVKSKKSGYQIQSISMPENLVVKIESILKEEDISKSDFYRDAVNEYLDKINEDKKKIEMKQAYENFLSVSKKLGRKDAKSKKAKWDIVTFMRKDRESH